MHDLTQKNLLFTIEKLRGQTEVSDEVSANTIYSYLFSLRPINHWSMNMTIHHQISE